MDGMAIIRSLLVADAGVTALVPAARIAGEELPQASALPSIIIKDISGVDRNIPSQGAARRVTERVQVTVLAANLPEQKQVQKAVRQACADQFPSILGLSGVVVHTDGRGPNFHDEMNSIRMGSQDFKVSYNEAA